MYSFKKCSWEKWGKDIPIPVNILSTGVILLWRPRWGEMNSIMHGMRLYTGLGRRANAECSLWHTQTNINNIPIYIHPPEPFTLDNTWWFRFASRRLTPPSTWGCSAAEPDYDNVTRRSSWTRRRSQVMYQDWHLRSWNVAATHSKFLFWRYL